MTLENHQPLTSATNCLIKNCESQRVDPQKRSREEVANGSKKETNCGLLIVTVIITSKRKLSLACDRHTATTY